MENPYVYKYISCKTRLWQPGFVLTARQAGKLGDVPQKFA